MIISWMCNALVFAGFVAIAALATESFARALGRPARWIWSVAVAIGALWPIVAVLASAMWPRLHDVPAVLPTVRIFPNGAALLGGPSGRVQQVIGVVAIAVWIIASVLLCVRLVRALLALRTVRVRAERAVVDGVLVLITESTGPATIGLRRHDVIVPRSVLALEEPLRRLVLRHEREHCSARDPLLLIGAGVALVLVPWNAALWFIARRLHLALEVDCDARVLAAEDAPGRYGRLLLWMAQQHGGLRFAPMLAAPPSHLERRIIAMRSRFERPSLLRLAGAASLLLVGVFGACSESAPDGPLTKASVGSPPRALAAPINVGAPYYEFQVEKPATQSRGPGALRYPDAMRLANREGEVLAQFVVNTDGSVDVPTFRVLKSSDAAFTEAVHAALTTMHFTPARVGGRAVRQVVQSPFTFSLQRNAMQRAP